MVGSAVARRFLSDNHTVSALYRSGSDRSLLGDVEDKLTWIEGDILDISSLETALVGIDFVVHTAAVVSFVPRDRDLMYKVNIEGTANIVNACLKYQINKLCHVAALRHWDARMRER